MEGTNNLRGDGGRVRTIITNAVYGSATQMCNTTIYINVTDDKRPIEILGHRIKGAQIKSSDFDEITDDKVKVRINGVFEVHVWYEAGGDTYVAKEDARFSEILPLKCLGGESYRNKKILAWISQQPTSLDTSMVTKAGMPSISVQIEYGLGVEVTGEAMLNVISYHQEREPNRSNEEVIMDTLEMFDVDVEAEGDD